MLRRLLAIVLALGPAACSGSVDLAQSSSDATSGGAGSGGGSAGGDPIVASSSTATASASASSGTGGGAPCIGDLTVAADNGAPIHLSHGCPGSWDPPPAADEPKGYLFAGGPVGAPKGLAVAACGAPNDVPELGFSAFDASGPGTYQSGVVQYTDETGQTWGVEGDPFDVTVSALGPVGGTIAGTFTMTVTHGGNAAHFLSGSFHVCHVQDEFAP